MKRITLLLFLLPLMAICQIPSYYDDVNLSLTGTALKDELATKVISTHTRFLSYAEVWEACKITDLDPNDATKVLLIYGYNDTDGNFRTDRTRSKDANGGNLGTDWNREHTYPKSLGNPNLGTSGPGSDAHHLRPADVGFNSDRSSKKFALGSGNAGDSNGGWYPGNEWKGDVARMMMYMYLRYGSQCLPTNVGIGSSSATPDDMIDLFLTWNAEDPVSQIEIIRNNYHGSNGTYAQGNRNPFIDNPAFATQIWGGPQAEDRFGNGSGSDTTAPSTPTDLIASNITQTETTLHWSASTDNVGVTGYTIYIDGVNSATVTSTTYTVTNLSPNTNYSFSISAKDAAGNTSNLSTTINVTTLTGGGSGTADELFFSEYIEGSSNNKALEIANFTGNAVDLNGYALKRNTNGGTSWGAAYNLNGQITNGDVFVIANNAANATITTIADVTTSSDALLFNGNDPVGLFKNNVLIDVIGNFGGGSANFAQDVTLRRKAEIITPNITYTTSEWDSYAIDTFDGLGSHSINGGGGNQDTEAPSAPTGLTATNITETTLTLSWNAASDNVGVTAYEIFRDGSLLASTTTTSYTITGLSAVTNYSFNVYAKDAAGNTSTASNTINVTTTDTTAPTIPANLAASNTSQTTTDLTWSAASDNVAVTGYDLYQNGSFVASTTATLYNVTGLSASTTYTFTVSAKDAAGNVSGDSNAVSVTTESAATSNVLLDTSFETGWEGWIEGGSDSYRINSSRSYDGNYSIRLRDNSGIASSMTSDAYNVSSYTELAIEFYFYSYSMENGEDFWLQYFDGNSWNTIASYVSGIDFNNDAFYVATTTISNANYAFPTNAQFRFTCDASSNADQIYIDKVSVVASSNAAKSVKERSIKMLKPLNTASDYELEIDEMGFYPNPAKGFTVLKTEIDLEDSSTDVVIKIISLDGRLVKLKKLSNVSKEYIENTIDLSDVKPGVYFVNISSKEGLNQTKKLVVQ